MLVGPPAVVVVVIVATAPVRRRVAPVGSGAHALAAIRAAAADVALGVDELVGDLVQEA
jgi:hypothetical protein